jgi:hypothetical protein
MAKARKGFDWSGSSYKKYDPAVTGYGDEGQWCRLFNMAMGFEEAQQFRAEQQRQGRWRDEYVVLSEMSGIGVNSNSMWDEIKKAFRKACMNCHPDRAAHHGKNKNQAEEEFKQVSAAYALLGHLRGES